MTPDAIAARLAPVGRLEFASIGTPARTLKDGEAVYAGLCVACHGSGAAGAPKLGDKKAWRPRIAQGLETLIKHATEGYKAMPPKGGGADLDPVEVARAVAWMADQGGANFKAPLARPAGVGAERAACGAFRARVIQLQRAAVRIGESRIAAGRAGGRAARCRGQQKGLRRRIRRRQCVSDLAAVGRSKGVGQCHGHAEVPVL